VMILHQGRNMLATQHCMQACTCSVLMKIAYLVGKSCIEEIARLTVHNASWLVGGSRGVHNKEVVLTVHWHWLKLSWLPFHCLLVNISYYYPVDIPTTVFSYSCAVQYHTILHGAGVIIRGCYCTSPGAMQYPSNYDVL